MEQLSAREIIDFIGNAKKKTPVKVYIKGSVKDLKFPKSIKAFAENTQRHCLVIGRTLSISSKASIRN